MLAISYTEGIENAWNNVAEFVPKFVAAVIIFLIGWFIAKVIRNIAIRILKAVQFDRWVDDAGIGAPIERAGYPDSGVLLANIIYWAVLLLTLQMAVDTFGDSAIQDALDGIVAFLPRLIVAIVIIVITGAIATKVRELVGGVTGGLDYGNALARIAAVAVWIVGIFAALNQIQVAEDIVNTLFSGIVATIGLILVVMFGVGGINAARDRFWPAVFDKVSGSKADDPV